jgi:acetylornithine deacetylase/succinyl-diaminopimelate desuccinylase-like protein
VQPADPLELWDSDPFELTERDGALYGRGAADDKGELVSRLAALRWFERQHGELPFGVKFVVEGEEEIGSPNLARYVEERAGQLAADAAVWEFGGVTAEGRPAVFCGLKGILTLELSVRTAGHDLHSSYGAVVENPIYRLSAALASLRDGDGRVAIAGFYDDVVAPRQAEQELVEGLPDEDERLAEVFGTSGFLGGARGKEFHRRLYFEPNVNYNGFHSGYGGPGAKTVLPAEARAKLDFRLVPNQDPEKVGEQLRRHLEAHGYGDVEIRVLEHSERPARADVEHPWVQQAAAALEDVYGQTPVVFPNSAGSGPMHPFVEVLGVPVVGIGCGYPGSRIHSPNEHMRLADFHRGVAALVRLLERYGGQAGVKL